MKKTDLPGAVYIAGLALLKFLIIEEMLVEIRSLVSQ